MSTMKIINSIKVTSDDIGKIVSIDEDGNVEFIKSNFGIVECLTYRNNNSTTVPKIINGAFTNSGASYGAYYDETPKDLINLVSTKTFDSDTTYVVTINAVFDDFAVYWGCQYDVTLSHYGTPVLVYKAGGTRSGSSGHGYEKIGKDFVAHFLWKPEVGKTSFDLSLTKNSGTTALLSASVVIQEYVEE